MPFGSIKSRIFKKIKEKALVMIHRRVGLSLNGLELLLTGVDGLVLSHAMPVKSELNIVMYFNDIYTILALVKIISFSLKGSRILNRFRKSVASFFNSYIFIQPDFDDSCA